jgi:CubicO group peptidase (beta-lactamase class C family)
MRKKLTYCVRYNRLCSPCLRRPQGYCRGAGQPVRPPGTPPYERYCGYENLADSTLLDAESRLNIASNGKQVTALAIAILAGEGAIGLDDPVSDYLPALRFSTADTIRIKDFLTHSSGIRDVYDLWSFTGLTRWEHPFSNENAYRLLARQ